MLSYRHAFHAGNHADVLKHIVLVQLLGYLNQKDKPYQYVDTHAGAGCYALDKGYAAQNAEFADGIGRLWKRKDLPPAVAHYVAVVRQLNPSGDLRLYPGSPWIAAHVARPDDRLRLHELHPTDGRLLAQTFADAGKRVQVLATEGLAGLKAALPPASRRGLVLIDPSYEVKTDYAAVVDAVKDALRRFATGTIAVWYPQLSRADARQLPEKLKTLDAKGWLNVSLQVAEPSRDGFGMWGSGMFVINPPWTLEAALRETLPWLTEVLAIGTGARFTLEAQENPPR